MFGNKRNMENHLYRSGTIVRTEYTVQCRRSEAGRQLLLFCCSVSQLTEAREAIFNLDVVGLAGLVLFSLSGDSYLKCKTADWPVDTGGRTVVEGEVFSTPPPRAVLDKNRD